LIVIISWDYKINNCCRRRCRPKSYSEKSELLAFWLSRKLNLRETVLKQENAKHNSRENKLVYSICYYLFIYTAFSPIKVRHIYNCVVILWVSSESLLFYAKWAIFGYINNKFHSMKWWRCPLCTKPTCLIGSSQY
jgi:hypothetical protein